MLYMNLTLNHLKVFFIDHIIMDYSKSLIAYLRFFCKMQHHKISSFKIYNTKYLGITENTDINDF